MKKHASPSRAGPAGSASTSSGGLSDQDQVGNAAIQDSMRAGGAGGFDAKLDALAPRTPEQAAAEATVGSGSEIPYRAEMEASFGTDLGHLQAHYGAREALGEVGAGAVASGNHVAFATPNPTTEQVAHEVGHTLQQGSGSGGVSTRGDASEQEARSVGATVASGGQVDVQGSRTSDVAMDWLDSVNASRDTFWGDLRNATSGELTNYLANIHGSAFQNWVTYMQSQGETSAGMIAVDAVIAGIGAIPGDVGAIVGAILGTAKSVWVYVQSQNPAGTLSFNDFVAAQGQAQAAISGQITGRSHPAFRALTALEASETATNRAEVRANAIAQARAGRNRMVGTQAIQQALTAGWMHGARDGWDTGDFSLDNAGYFNVTGMMVPGQNRYVGLTAQVDDVDRPDGTIEAIRQSWGANTPLVQLPFAIDVGLGTVVGSGAFDQHSGPNLEATKDRLGTAYTFGSGDRAHFGVFTANPVTTAHLTPD
ncbi:MAG: DUF4157 domain-containing protein [Deltaproteobacteria bacterium]|nr:DUF4157 domain-containing protein [Deltaproteobacteria bacterium]